MRTFTRITISPTVNDGLASIRDTGITVSDVVQRVMAGQSESAVLAAYPTLEHEDVFEALGYAIDDLISNIASWRNEGLTPILAIKGYSEVLISNHESNGDPKDDETCSQFLDTIHAKSLDAMVVWNYLRHWAALTYEPSHFVLRVLSLSDLIDKTLSYRTRFAPGAIVNVEVPSDLPPVKCDWSIVDVLCDLLADRFYLFLKQEGTLRVEHASDTHLRLTIYRKYQESSPGQGETRIISQLADFNSSPFAIAALIVRQHGSELDIQATDTGVTFIFSLPVWNDAEA